MKRIARSLPRFLPAVILTTAVLAPTLLRSADSPAPPRGQPIKPIAAPARGEPIKPLTAAPARPAETNIAIPSAIPAPVADANGFSTVGFDTLSAFRYDVPEENPLTPPKDAPAKPAVDPDTQIPETVKAYSGKRVAVKGFMLPLKVEGGLVTELLLMRDQSMCCYGAVPKINEWVAVKMTSKGIKPVMDQAVTLYGTIKIGAMRENGYLVGIYQMNGERMDGPAGM
jgi:hypothetical protein